MEHQRPSKTFSQRRDEVLDRMKSAAERTGRTLDDVRLLAVSKAHPPEVLVEAVRAGQLLFGESYAQELEAKWELSHSRGLGARFHFIGGLQRNKVRRVVGKVELIHSVDRTKLMDEIDRQAARLGLVQEILIEVNLGGEDSKAGCSPDQVDELVQRALNLENVRLVGLMTVPPPVDDPEDARPYFARLRAMRDRLARQMSPETASRFTHLSMGMSHDFSVAIEEGATIVRVGTLLFGPRNYAASKTPTEAPPTV